MESNILTPDYYLEYLRKNTPPMSKASGNLTMTQFFELMFYTLEIEKPNLVFAPSYPQYLFPQTREYEKTMENPTALFKDTITYSITREEPGSIGGNKQPFDGTREIVPRYREVQKMNDTESQMIYGQWFDSLVQFDVWTLTNWEAENLALWFKRFMTVHRGFLKDMGLSEIFFWWRGRDEVASKIQNHLHLRTLVYYVRTEEISSETDFNLKELRVKLTNNFINGEESNG